MAESPRSLGKVRLECSSDAYSPSHLAVLNVDGYLGINLRIMVEPEIVEFGSADVHHKTCQFAAASNGPATRLDVPLE